MENCKGNRVHYLLSHVINAQHQYPPSHPTNKPPTVLDTDLWPAVWHALHSSSQHTMQMFFWKLKINAAQFNKAQCLWAQEEYPLGHNNITYNSKTPPTLLGKCLEGHWINALLEYGGVCAPHYRDSLLQSFANLFSFYIWVFARHPTSVTLLIEHWWIKHKANMFWLRFNAAQILFLSRC